MLATGLLVGQVFNVLIPSLTEEYKNENLFRAWTDPVMSLYFVHPFVLGLIMAWIWSYIRPLLPGRPASAGLVFGLIYMVTIIPGMLMSFSSFPLSAAMVISWLVSGLAEGLVAGWVLAYLNRSAASNPINTKPAAA